MRLGEALTDVGVRAFAGKAVFDRGRAYVEAGAVRELMIAGPEARAVVLGTVPYRVHLVLAGRDVQSTCTCPHGGPMCKHVVAVALSVIGRDDCDERLPAVVPTPEPFPSRAAVEAWAAARQVSDLLARPASCVTDRLTVAPGWLLTTALTIGDVAVSEPRDEPVALARVRAEVARAAREILADEAGRVATALDEEAKLLALTPAPDRAEAWRRVLAARAAVRATVTPQRGPWPAATKLTLDDDGDGVRWREGEEEAVVTWRSDRMTGSCSCTSWDRRMIARAFGRAPQANPGPCVHLLAALDATLVALTKDDDLGRALVARITAEPWQKALAQLDDLGAPSPHVAGDVGWRLRRVDDRHVLLPTVERRDRRGRGTSRLIGVREVREGRVDAEAADRAVAELLSVRRPESREDLGPALAALVGHPRVVYEHADQRPLAVRRGELRFAVTPVDDDLELVPTVGGRPLTPELRRHLREAGPTTAADLRPEDGECLVFDVNRRAHALLQLLERHGDRFPPAAHEALLDRLAVLDPRLAVELPSALLGANWSTTSTVVLRLELAPGGGLAVAAWIRVAPEAPLVVPGQGREVLPLVRDGVRGHVRRALAQEVAQVGRALAALPVTPTVDDTGPPWRYRVAEVDDALTLATSLDELPAGVVAEWTHRRPEVRRDVTAAALTLRVADARDWFDIQGQVTVDGEAVELAVLLEAARVQRRYVRLGPDRWLELADALRAQLARLAAHQVRHRGQVVSTTAIVPAMLELAEAGATIDGADTWRTLVAKVRAAARSTPKLPRDLTATLRDYQRDGFTWMMRLAAWGAGGVLADDMGLGKTVQTIAVLAARASLGPALVVAPTSVTGNWLVELARFAPRLRPRPVAERDARAEVIDGAAAGDVVVVSYALLTRERERLAARRFATVVFDEAQAIKNASTQRSQAARALDAEFRVALTGTPVENRVGELWSIFAAVFPALFGPWEHFRATYAVPIERAQSAEAQALLAHALRPFVLRRRKDEVARELPARTEIALTIPLTEPEAALYEQVRLAAIAKLEHELPELGVNEQRLQILAELTRLRLAACHPRLHDPLSAVPSSKLERLLELVEELRAEGHRALVFSQFVSHLALVRAAFDDAGVTYQYLDGATPADARSARVAAFQGGAGDVFLISLKAGGTGLNLTAADYVIHLDPWWNPAVEDQASDRAHRIGQTRPVTIYRLVAADTIEAKILELHAAKRDLAAAVLSGTDGAVRATSDELLGLLGAPPPVAATGAPPPARPRSRARRAAREA